MDSFCVLPFYGLEVSQNSNKTSPCCLIKNPFNVENIKQQMLNGIRPVECSVCWNIEERGKKSDRQLKNEAFDFYANKDIKVIQQDCKKGNYSTQIVKLYTSNLCNATCATCNSNHSSAWASLTNAQNKKLKITNTPFDRLDYSNIKMLTFVGGEPLYEKRNFGILQNLLSKGNSDCFVSLNTNGSVHLTDNQIDTLKSFKNLNICISIDGIQEKFEYIRFPLKWETLLKNIDIFRKNSIVINVSYTISNLNLLYYEETIEWFNKEGLSFNHNLVSYPSYFNINSLPNHVKDNFSSAARSLLRPHSSIDDKNFLLFAQEIRFQDQLKKISIKDFMPDMHKIITENGLQSQEILLSNQFF